MSPALAVLAMGGLANSVYFTLLAFRLIPPNAGVLPKVCRLSDHACEAVVHTRYGRLFGLPNSVPGIAFYLLLLAVAATRDPRLLDLALVASAATILIGVYLIWALVAKLKAP